MCRTKIKLLSLPSAIPPFSVVWKLIIVFTVRIITDALPTSDTRANNSLLICYGG